MIPVTLIKWHLIKPIPSRSRMFHISVVLRASHNTYGFVK